MNDRYSSKTKRANVEAVGGIVLGGRARAARNLGLYRSIAVAMYKKHRKHNGPLRRADTVNSLFLLSSSPLSHRTPWNASR